MVGEEERGPGRDVRLVRQDGAGVEDVAEGDVKEPSLQQQQLQQ